jgi:L-fuconolactonase
MPDFSIVDTHLHVWDQSRLKYSAFDDSPLFGHPYHVEDYQKACGDLDVEAMVFLECYADFWEGGGQYIEEIEFVEDEQKRDPRIKAIIPMAPLEWGNKVEPMLRKMRDEHPSVRGIRRIMEFDADPRALTLSEGFIEGVNLLAKFGWSFDINPNHTQMDFIREFVRKIEGVPMILDHCGKPGIRQGKIEQFREDMQDLAKHSDMWVKLSDLPPYASANWTQEELRPYIEATLDAFGPERTIYAGDYPILLQATNLTQWVEVLDNAFAELGLSETETRKIYRDNANAFYRLGLGEGKPKA